MLIHIKNVYKQKEIVVAVKNEQAYFKTRGLLKHQETSSHKPWGENRPL